jgi:hypothetical protein
MRAASADLGTLWEGVRAKYDFKHQPVPKRWRLLYQVVKRLLIKGAVG